MLLKLLSQGPRDNVVLFKNPRANFDQTRSTTNDTPSFQFDWKWVAERLNQNGECRAV